MKFSAQEEELVNAQMDHVYNGFIARVAEGRGLSEDIADGVARGRVWTGRQALEEGLVDELGGLSDALGYAATEIGYTNRFTMPLIVLPPQKSAMEQLLALLNLDTVNVMTKIAFLSETLFSNETVNMLTAAGQNPALVYEPVRLK